MSSVPNGFGKSRRYGEDYNETFASIVRGESVRILFGMATNFCLTTRRTDIKTAFLNSHRADEAYMEQPKGFVDTDRLDYVCKLKCSIYGPKQSPYLWNQEYHHQFIRPRFSTVEHRTLQSFSHRKAHYPRCFC